MDKIFSNFLNLECKNVISGIKINDTYFESLIQTDADNDFFREESNNNKLIQIRTSKKDDSVFLYFEIPLFLYERDFDIYYNIDKKLSEALEINNDGFIHYYKKGTIFKKELDYFYFRAKKINKPKKDILNSLNIIETEQDKSLLNIKHFTEYTLKDNFIATKYYHDYKNDTLINKIITRIKNEVKISDLLEDYNEHILNNGPLSFKYYANNKGIIKAAFVNNSLVYM